MKSVLKMMPGFLLGVVLLVSSVQGQMATWDEALTVAENWTMRVIQNNGNWGGSDWAQVVDIQEFKRNERVIGYFCKVEPIGFIVVSLRKELAPIKAYSTQSNLDPESDEGMADLLKMKMEGILDAIEEPIRLYGVDAEPYVQGLLEIDYRPAWDQLCGQAQVFNDNLQSDPHSMNYQGGQSPLLTSRWHQLPPYNNFCPPMNCSWPDQGYQNQCAVAGCGAIAIAQIMRYWAWPPEGVGYDDVNNVDYRGAYEWTNMLDAYYWSSSEFAFVDGAGGRCGSSRIAAVAELCYEAGRAMSATYECTGTTSNLLGQYLALTNRFRYHDEISFAERSENTAIQWFNGVKADLAANRLISYYIPANQEGHAIVIDGWAEDGIGKRYHVNYGWTDENATAWYNLDELLGGDPAKEIMLLYIRPAVALPSVLGSNRVYGREAFNYRYFTEDTWGQNVTLAAGQKLQFLPKVSVNCTGGSIKFQAATGNDTELFSIKGTDQGKIKIVKDSALVLYAGGGIRFHGSR